MLTKTSSLSTTNFTSGTRLYIQGAFEVDVDVSFTGCIVKMGSNAVITTSGAVSLAIQNSFFFSCDTMWQGINLNPFGAANIGNSEFEDALTCFSINSIGLQSFNGNTFNRNRVGFQVFVPFTPYPFYGNTFTCTSGLSAPWSGTVSRCGMEIFDTGVDLSSYGQSANIFTDMHCGIFSRRSYLGLKGVRFMNMTTGVEDFGGQAAGSAIIALGGELDINPDADAFDLGTACLFENNDLSGITARGTNLRIRNSLFSRNRFGIDSRENNDAEFINVYFCEFRDLGILPLIYPIVAGIFLERSNSTSAISENQVLYSRFVTAASSPVGIIFGIRVIGSPSTNYCSITNNWFENYSSRMSRFVSIVQDQADNFAVLGNDMEYFLTPNTLDRYGVELLGGTGFGHQVKFNDVTGDDDENEAFTYRCAFHIVNSPNIDICTNTTDRGYRGFHFKGQCNPVQYAENIMGSHQLGLTIDYTAEIGVQTRKLNRWSTTTGAYGILAAQNINVDYQNSLFIVHSQDTEFLPPTDIREPDDWFYFLEGDPDPCIQLSHIINLDSFDLRVASGDNQPESAAAAWDAERRFYFKLLRFPQLGQQTEVATFFGQIDNASAGKFAQAEYALWEAVLMDDSTQEALDNIRQAVAGIADSLQLLDSLLVISPDSGLLAQRNTLMGDISGLITHEEQTREQAATDRMAALDTLAAMLNGLPRNTAYENARVNYLGWAIQKRKGILPDSTELNTLHALVLGDFEELGSTVIEAGAVLPAEDPVLAELTDPACSDEPQSKGSSGTSGTPTPLEFTIFPNPANARINIRFSEPVTGKLLIFNAFGELAGTLPVQKSAALTFETGPLSSGIYFCRLHTGGGVATSRPFAISH